MKPIFILCIAFCVAITSFASSGFSVLPKKAADVYLPVGSTGQKISLLDLSRIDIKQFETLSGRHLNFLDRLGFKMAQKKLRKSINADGTIDSKKLNKFLADGDHSSGFHLGGFALGFFLELIGVLLAYVVWDDENKRNRIKWAWIGCGVSVVLYLIFILIVFSSAGVI